MNLLAKIYVTLKGSVLDPQGAAVTHALHALSYDAVRDVRIGKYMEVSLIAASETEAHELVRGMCERLLTNPVIETYTYELAEVEQ